MLLFTVGAGKKPADLTDRRATLPNASRSRNDNYLLQNLKK
jgi:hypothetical protein